MNTIIRPSECKTIKSLSIQQPWAYAIFNLGKRTENRTWRTNGPPGLCLIHTGKHKPTSGDWDDVRDIVELGGVTFEMPSTPLFTGGILGIVDFWQIDSGINSKWDMRGQNHWRMKDVLAFPAPVPWKGQRGLFPVTITPELREQLILVGL